MGCPDWAGMGDGERQFCYLQICDVFLHLRKTKPSSVISNKGGGESKEFPPLKRTNFLLEL